MYSPNTAVLTSIDLSVGNLKYLVMKTETYGVKCHRDCTLTTKEEYHFLKTLNRPKLKKNSACVQ